MSTPNLVVDVLYATGAGAGVRAAPLPGESAAFATAVCWSLTALFFSFSGRRVGSDVVNRSRLLFAIGLYAVAHRLLVGSWLPVGAGSERWGWLALSSVLGLVVGDSALFQAYVLVGPRLSMLVMSLVPILGTCLAWVLLGETVTATEVTGIALTVGGVAWVVVAPDPAGTPGARRDYRLGIVLALVGALGQASNLIAARYGLAGDFPAVTGSYIRILVAAAALWSVSLARRDVGRIAGRWRDRRALAAMLGGALVGPFLGIWLSLYAVQHARIGIASTLMALPPVLLIPLEYVVHGRRTSRRAIAGTALAIAGVALIFLGP